MTEYTPHEATVREAQALPIMLPARLVGRDPVLAQVYAQLKENHPVLVHGAAGSGKTALIGTLASAYAQQPGGVLWFNVSNPRLEELLVRVGRAYNLLDVANADNPLGLIGAVENTLKRHKPLIVLDGAISPDVAMRFITRCADGLPTVIISEAHIEGPWAALELPLLETDAAAVLFKLQSGLTTPDHDAAVRDLVQFLSHQPFAVVVAARAMLAAKQAPAAYLASLQQITAAVGGNPLVGALTASFRGLTAPLQGLILMMGATFNGSGSADLFSLVSGAPPEAVQQAVNLLAQLNLVERTTRYGAPYYRLHFITHTFAQRWLQGSNKLDELQLKVRDSIVDYAKRYNGSTAEAHNKLAAEIDSFLAAARWSADKGERQIAGDLAAAITHAGDFISTRGYLYEVGLLRELARVATTFPGHGIPEPAAALPFEEPEEALDYDADTFEDSLEQYDPYDTDEDDFDDEAYDDEDDADDDDDRDNALMADADEDEDEEILEPLATRLFNNPLQALDDDEDDADDDDVYIDEEEDETVHPLRAQIKLSVDLETTDINKLRTSLIQARQFGDRALQLKILEAIGKLQVNQAMENEAIATYGEVLTLQETQNDQAGVLDTLDMLSALMVKTENSRAAEMYATRGIKLAETLLDTPTRIQLLMTLGDARQQLGESEQAQTDYGGALQLARSSDDTQNEAIILYKLGYAQLDSGDAETAVDTWEQALTLFKTQEKRAYEGRTLGGLGTAYSEMGRWSEALSFHTSALHIAREVNNDAEAQAQLTSLAYASVQANQLGQAVMRYRQALYLAYQKDDHDDIIGIIVDLARLLVESRKHVTVAELLINDAIARDPTDPDVRQLKERVDSEKKLAEAAGVEMISAHGTAQQYAENAYKLL